jgi:hypothetical protein
LLLVVALVALTPHRRHAPAALTVAEPPVALGTESPSPRVEEPPDAEPPAAAGSAPEEMPPIPEVHASAPPIPPEVTGPPTPVLAETALDLPTGCHRYRTAVNFYDSLAEATRNARTDNKLVFVLHVAGNFEEPGFT